nr:radical SAM protein [Candidatus Woesearchaeota archaeon]
GLNCDLNCVMCQQKHISHVKLSKEFYESLEKFLPEIEEISMSGGEFLAIKEAKDFFMNFDFKKHKQVKFNFITNGQLLTENIIKRMIEHCNFVNISIDSGLKETYEEIRKGAKWDLLMKNLEIIAKYKKIFAKKNSNLQIILSFVVMKKNFKEIPIFVRICDKLSFIPQLDWMRGNKPKNDNLLIKGNEKELEMLFGIVQDLKKSKKYIAHLKNIENEIICHLKK